MSRVLIIKTGAAGDVLRTTFVLEHLCKNYEVHWLTDPNTIDLINSDLCKVHTDFLSLQNYDFEIVYSLEEDLNLLRELQEKIKYKKLVGCFNDQGSVNYRGKNTEWFDMSLVSVYGIDIANRLKLMNQKSFQELLALVFDFKFEGQRYNKLKYNPEDAIVSGDIAIAKFSGDKWPNKNWKHYDALIEILRADGKSVNILPQRSSIKKHVADIASHKLVICGDSLPMHIATALNIPSIALFTCTSPYEIYDYSLISKIVSKDIKEFYYKKGIDEKCVTSIRLEQVIEEIKKFS